MRKIIRAVKAPTVSIAAPYSQPFSLATFPRYIPNRKSEVIESASESMYAFSINSHPADAKVKGIIEIIPVKAGDKPSIKAT